MKFTFLYPEFELSLIAPTEDEAIEKLDNILNSNPRLDLDYTDIEWEDVPCE